MAKPVTLAPVHPNVGVAVAYRKRLDLLLAAMHRDVTAAIRDAYADTPPEMAADNSPAKTLQAIIKALEKKWSRRFDDIAPALAKRFSGQAGARADAALAAALKKAGFTVQFKMSRKVNDVAQASVAENVSLITSIPAKYMADVEGAVMRSVQVGRDLGSLSKALQEHYGVNKRRAAFISLDQNNKATAAITRARQSELGISEAIWVHSSAGKHPRPSHVQAGRDRVRYAVNEGWLDPATGKRIWPGTEIRCRCVSRAVIPGLERAA